MQKNERVELEQYKPIFEMLLQRIRRQILVHKETVIVPENQQVKAGPAYLSKGSEKGADSGNG